jgi:hypothetical protein
MAACIQGVVHRFDFGQILLRPNGIDRGGVFLI